MSGGETLDLLVVGAGPTGIALGVEALRAGLTTRVLDRGPLIASLVGYPTEMTFFTTRERLEILGVPFAIPEDKPSRRQAIAYYQAVAAKHELPLGLYEDVTAIRPEKGSFVVASRGRSGSRERRALAVAVATGYFCNPRRLGVPGEELPWVRGRYLEPYAHFGERVLVIGGGNSAAETALDLFRHGARVTLVHRGAALKETVKYWLKPDVENRIAAGEIDARFESRVLRFEPGGAVLEHRGEVVHLAAEAAYVLVGYTPETGLLAGAGVRIDPGTGVPDFDPASGETNVPGLYVAGTVQAGRETHRIFIENSRDHAPLVVRHLAARLRGTSLAPSAVPRGGA